MAMQKRLISLTDPQTEFLKKESERLGISVSEVVRRVLDKHRETAGE